MTTTNTDTPQKASKGFLRRNAVSIIFTLGLIITTMAAFIRTEVVKKRLIHQMEAQKETMQIHANQVLAQNTEELLKFSMKGFDWAIRGELIRGNEENVQQYIAQLVKEERVQEVDFVNSKGIIQLSSNKKREGQSFNSSEYDFEPLSSDSPEYSLQEEGKAILFAPVMGLEKRLGTLMIVYTVDLIHFQADASFTD